MLFLKFSTVKMEIVFIVTIFLGSRQRFSCKPYDYKELLQRLKRNGTISPHMAQSPLIYHFQIYRDPNFYNAKERNDEANKTKRCKKISIPIIGNSR